MPHKWHVEDSFVGCLPDELDVFATKREATDFLRATIGNEQEILRACGLPLFEGTLRAGYYHSGPRRIFIEPCDDPQCEWGGID